MSRPTNRFEVGWGWRWCRHTGPAGAPSKPECQECLKGAKLKVVKVDRKRGIITFDSTEPTMDDADETSTWPIGARDRLEALAKLVLELAQDPEMSNKSILALEDAADHLAYYLREYYGLR